MYVCMHEHNFVCNNKVSKYACMYEHNFVCNDKVSP